jgi:hypothetical protein
MRCCCGVGVLAGAGAAGVWAYAPKKHADNTMAEANWLVRESMSFSLALSARLRGNVPETGRRPSADPAIIEQTIPHCKHRKVKKIQGLKISI